MTSANGEKKPLKSMQFDDFLFFSVCDVLAEMNIDKAELEHLKRCLEANEDL